MRNRTLLTFLLTALALAAASSSAARAQATAPSCAGITTLADCPDTGCGGPGADPLLNRMKNRTQDASSPVARSLADIRRLRQPRSFTTGQSRRGFARVEESAVVTTGFLSRASASGQESTNCGLSGADNNDVHLDLVSRPGDPRATAVTAEITPRVRAGRTGWDTAKLRFLARNSRFVRVTGWMMLDTQHIRRPLVRSTNWEVHPVTEFEVCTGRVRDCRRGTGWTSLEDFRVP